MRNDGTLKDVMTSNLTVIKSNTPFKIIKNIFDRDSFHHIPVIDNLDRIKGIISRSDFAKLAFKMSTDTGGITYSEKKYKSLRAEDIMTKNPVVLNSDDSIDLAADLFLENVYHAIPVMEGEFLVGIVTSHDLLTHAYYKAPVGASVEN